MSGLSGTRVALLETRMGGELAALIRRHGGEAYAVRALQEVARPDPAAVSAFIDGLVRGTYQVVIFMTGAGAAALFEEATRLERLPQLVTGLQRVTTVCRGPKPVTVLRSFGVASVLTAEEPFTTVELLETMGGIRLRDRGIALVHGGERSDKLVRVLQAQGARLTELCLYEWRLPEDLGPLEQLVDDLVKEKVDAIMFTSQIQARHLFEVAARRGEHHALAHLVNTGIVVASVGPTCSAALQRLGVTPDIEPACPRMGHLVTALAERFEDARRAKLTRYMPVLLAS